MFWRGFPTRVWWFTLFLIGGLSAIFYLAISNIAKSSITEQLLRHEQTIARAQANNITSFFQLFGHSVVALTQVSSIGRRDTTTVSDMDVFVDQWQDRHLIGGVVLTDKYGIVQFNSNVLGTHDIGASLADRDFFTWAKTSNQEGKYFVSQPVVSRLGASRGKVIVVVASPVYQKDTFAGVVAASVDLSSLTNNYLESMKLSDLSDTYLINEKGNLLYDRRHPELVNMNIFDILNNSSFSEGKIFSNNIRKALEEGSDGKILARYSISSDSKPEEYLIAYSHVLFDNGKWLLITSSPIQDMVKLTTPLYIRIATVLLLVFFTILVFGVAISQEIGKRLT